MHRILNMNRNNTRIFHLNNDEIVQILIADDSDDESDIALDEEDQAFIENDLDTAKEVIIEGQNVQGIDNNVDIIDEPLQKKPKRNCNNRENEFKWNKNYKRSEIYESEYPYGKIKFLNGVNDNIEPFDVYEKTCNFDVLVNRIVVQSELYMQQKGTHFQQIAMK